MPASERMIDQISSLSERASPVSLTSHVEEIRTPPQAGDFEKAVLTA
jgi:hypothetical protein